MPRRSTGPLATARHRITLDIVNNRIVVNSMEPRGAIGEYDPGDDTYTLVEFDPRLAFSAQPLGRASSSRSRKTASAW